MHQIMENGDIVPIIGRNNAACYENPLFEEEGTVINDTQTKLHRQTDGLRTKPYDLPNAAQTSVHYRPSKPKRRKGLYILGLLLALVAIIAIITIIIVGQRDDSSTEPSKQGDKAGSSREPSTPIVRPSTVRPTKENVVWFQTNFIEGSLRIIQGPFSSYKDEYSDKSSTSYSLFSSSFTYQINNILTNSELGASFSHIEILDISSGSVLVHFILHFRRNIDIYSTTSRNVAGLLIEGLSDSLFIIDKQSVTFQLKDPALSVITTSKPGVCVPVSSANCMNFSSWDFTSYPNFLGHRSPVEEAAAEAAHEELFQISCGKDFWCAVFNPKCKRNKTVPPCRAYCKVVFSSCGAMYTQSNISSLLNCDDLPDSDDPNVCFRDPFKPGKCFTNNETRCQDLGYNKVAFPNFAGMRSPYQAQELIHLMEMIGGATKCYKYHLLFACTSLMPKCSGTGLVPYHAIPPCRSLCNAFKSRCSIFMDIFWYPWPKELYCDSFPDVDDPNICLGYKTAHEPPTIEECPAGEDRCDNTRCIPYAWKCDGFPDCQDGSDEKSIQTTLPLRKCVNCPAGMFRCSYESAICIESSSRCDGVEDCPTASDERGCLKLDDGGRQGIVTMYSSSANDQIPICSIGWTKDKSDIVCSQMGYIDSTSQKYVNSVSNGYFSLTSARNGSKPEYIGSQLKLTNTCVGGTVVSISCGLPVCGTRPAYIHQSLRVVGGAIADPNAFPWQVAIFGGADHRYFCGGTIIAENWVLTAAHCIGGLQNPNELLIRAGQPRRDTYSPYLQEFHPANLFVHKLYNSHTVDNDIALIRLKEKVLYNDHVRPICLPKTAKRLPVGTRCTVIGWGRQGDRAPDYERQIRQVNLEVTDWKKCKHAIENAEIQVPYQLTDHMFCAGGGLGHDSCAGDSGGPLLCSLDKSKDTWYEAGIVSWGVACAYPNVPGVYTNLPGYLDWIRNTTGLSYL
ncbi:atrial natriuretic peptide-converting enzyme-like isoform X2 [Ruditapes philippinarum]|uniref:atrial natriuretic peptide-converting enzyme-like isoform X2 n=1 Tax=Ruditapes philippinarum TaxID=129788 RepID=UPI00295B204B|nr:atrial natriuretic peptide-converting enzyme-like isoform X2 [Ruditapes philippinarum]